MTAGVTVALVGNPNTGKTTLFNALTGARERTGNWSGVTVARAEAEMALAGTVARVVDLPGIYELEGHTLDERETGDYLRLRRPGVVVNVVDASSLERSLCLTLALRALGMRLVTALNLTDVAERRGLRIDAAALARALGVPVVPVVASRGEGIEALREALWQRLGEAGEPAGTAAPAAGDASIGEAAAQARRERARAIAHAVTRRAAPPGERVSDRVDRWLLHGRVGVPAFLAILYAIFWVTVRATQPLVEFTDAFAGALLVHGPRAVLEHAGCPAWLVAVLADGAGAGLVAVATFIPPIFAIFLCLGILEGSGYMPRAAFVMDRLLRAIGLPGKAFIPLVVGFGCTVPGLLATRTLAQRRERVLTMLLTPFMSCGARLPVYTVFALAFFPNRGDRIVFALYVIGIALAVLSGLLLHRTILPGAGADYVLELPPYQFPPWRLCLEHAWFNLRGFLARAGRVIVSVALALSVLNACGNRLLRRDRTSPSPDSSVSAAIGRAITPVFHGMGIDDANWPATVGLMTGVLAKESVIGTLDVLYAPGQTAPGAPGSFSLRHEIRSSLRELAEGYRLIPRSGSSSPHGSWPGMLTAMRGAFGSGASAFAYLLFVLIYSPCLAALAVLAREAGWRWMAFSVGYQTALAWMVSTGFYQVVTWHRHPGASARYLAAIACAAALGGLLLRRQGLRMREGAA